ncbi:fatty-acid peroxygenase [Streptomyces sp. DSM 42143]|uniref:cytochrome P450 n=1 Tax=Streptomyces TaxID=1883 RepID=UPI0025B5C0F5|nr:MULTISPECIES: cytochrome P450 [unclassified Streptomyces]MDN3244350.1 cytochrome P450 [Streptomyces sp. ZSW22]MDN3253443.1 cytochrome P450 [Streptomyces sp. MA25(2023)]MDQ0389601.1 fatty-acid peroxygenase [Streptomyces sp. DSM 42143]
MDAHRRPLLDRTLSLLTQGYAWLPDRMRDSADSVVRTRLLGRPALAVRGPDAVRFFYDEAHVHRHGALPAPVLDSLFGQGAVHTLDGDAHRARKELFLPLLDPDRVTGLTEHVTAAWDEAVHDWSERPRLVLFDEAGVVLTRGVCRWAGLPREAVDAEPLARDLIAMVDGFATPGPRHLRARRARSRQETRMARLIEEVRSEAVAAPKGSVLERVSRHRDTPDGPLDARTAAVELLNVLRPTAAVSWFVAFSAHALHRWPAHRERLRAGDGAFATAFAHEVRRFYPFAPFLGGRTVTELTWHGESVPSGGILLLDVYGQNHDEELWTDPYAFRPERFLDRPPERDDLIPQGGGDPDTGHRCPGERITVGLLEALAVRLARLEYTVPEQDLRIPLHRIPTRPRSGFAVTGVRAP